MQVLLVQSVNPQNFYASMEHLMKSCERSRPLYLEALINWSWKLTIHYIALTRMLYFWIILFWCVLCYSSSKTPTSQHWGKGGRFWTLWLGVTTHRRKRKQSPTEVPTEWQVRKDPTCRSSASSACSFRLVEEDLSFVSTCVHCDAWIVTGTFLKHPCLGCIPASWGWSGWMATKVVHWRGAVASPWENQLGWRWVGWTWLKHDWFGRSYLHSCRHLPRTHTDKGKRFTESIAMQ